MTAWRSIAGGLAQVRTDGALVVKGVVQNMTAWSGFGPRGEPVHWTEASRAERRTATADELMASIDASWPVTTELQTKQGRAA